MDLYRFILILILLLTAKWVHANEIQVNTLNDETDAAPGDGFCVTQSGQCSLRAAITEANHNGQDNFIVLPAGEIIIGIEGRGEEQNLTGDLDIYGLMHIVGESSQTIINTNGIDRLFDVHSGAELSLQNLLLTGAIDGSTEQSYPHNLGSVLKIHPTAAVEMLQVDIKENSSLNFSGSVILQQGILTAEMVTFTDNLNSHVIWVDGPVTKLKTCLMTGHDRQLIQIEGLEDFGQHDLIEIERCSLVENNSPNQVGVMFVGSMINNINIINTTISQNESKTALIVNDNASQLLFKHSTIYNNHIKGDIQGNVVIQDIHGNAFAATYFSNTLIANNSGVAMQMLGGGIRSLGGNYFGVISDGINQGIEPLASDVVDAKEPVILTDLIHFNQYSAVRMPLDDAAVIDIGIEAGCTETDQINQNRSQPFCDAGAIEWQSDLIFRNSFD
ncbi:MAG: CSLREA domain-containing protein [Marinicella sp.]|nr:CSLREA domain-containing protein [Xanthomonadales bacterium]